MAAKILGNCKKFLFFGWKAILIVILNRFAVMLIFKYKKLLFLFLVTTFAFTASAQQSHFVYLQSDNGKPFYVKMDKKILSSSSEGYIIIPEIESGVYQLKVGFPKKEYPEEAFTLSVADNNEGYLIKHFDDKGLQLFNLETLALISGNTDSISMTVASSTTDNNPFTKMLANVVKDSTILQNHQVVVENPAKPVDTSAKGSNQVTENTVATAVDTTSVATDNLVSAPVASDTSSKATNSENSSFSSEDSSVAATGSPISKLLSKKEKDGLEMVYADENGNKTDTVRVFIPAEKDQSATASEATNNDNFNFTQNNNAADTAQLTITPTVVKSNKEKKGFVLRKDTVSMAADSAGIAKTAPEQVFYIGPGSKEKEKTNDTAEKKSSEEKKGLFSGITLSKSSKEETSKTEKKPANKIEVLPNVVTSSKTNSDCKAFADNEDFLRLRKKMASEDNNEGMIKVAQKFFRSRCFSTSQIKDLSYLFLSDEGKYMFFDAAYAHTSDSDQYPTLKSQLKDPYYQHRFEAMIKK